MTIIVKSIIGVDISKDSFDVCFGTLDNALQQKFPGRAKFPNTQTGFRKFVTWTLKHQPTDETSLWFVLEATGVYYEALAYYLRDHGYQVAVILPTKMKHYTKTLEIKSKTDALDARAISQFGLERPLTKWTPPSPQLRRLKELTREHDALQEHATALKNQLHAKHHSHQPGGATLRRLEVQLELLERQLADVEHEMHAIVESDSDLNGRITNITSAKGIGFITAAKVIAETGGFALLRNQKQLASYAGFDVVLKESGTRRGKPAISKKGNSHLRRAVYMPALTAIRCNKHLKEVFLRLVRTRGNKMIALTAVARKLLCLIFTLWKSGKPYDPNYSKAHTS